MPAIDFNGQVAIVTGAGNGLGKDYALALAARGAKVVVNDLGGNPDGLGGSQSAADSVVQQILAAGGEAVASYDSVATRAGGDAIIAAAMDTWGRVDVLINNAGNQRNNRFEVMTDEEFDAVLDVHLKGAFYISQSAYKVMMQQQYGRFVFTSSASGVFGNYIRANYASGKAGVVGLMNAIGQEGERYGIRANGVLPVAASRLGQAPADALFPEWQAKDPRVKPGIELIGAKSLPEYVTPLILFLSSRQCLESQALWSAVAGRYSRVFIGVTRGWFGPSDRPATAEEILANLDTIQDRSIFTEPHSVSDEFDHLLNVVRQQQ